MDRQADNGETIAVETALGRLAGMRRGAVASFKGIPFACPPVGPLRWRLPEPAQPWPGTRDATFFAPTAPQAPTQIEAFLGTTIGEQSEDCLYLNVWTPACDTAKRPVMVWIHGGAFAFGAGSHGVYNGRRLAERDVVVVTINYRLGALGFLALAAASEGRVAGMGAEGLADQILALDWVKRNIAAFGGDPDNVTLFGESAGAMSTGCLLTAAPARGLFHKAILQSGACHVGYSPERAGRVVYTLLAEMGLSSSEAHKIADAPYGALIAAQIAVLAKGSNPEKDTNRVGLMPFQPAIDGALLRSRPIDLVREGAGKDIPLIVGTTRDEWKLFTGIDPLLRFLSARKFVRRVERLAGDAARHLLDVYCEGSPFERFNAMMTDKAFAVPAARLLDARGNAAPAFAYRFDWRSSLLGGIMGACHALDIGFTFGTHKKGIAGTFFGTGLAAEALADTMMDAWTSFARTGDPATQATGPWPRYDAQSRPTLIFGDGAPHIMHTPNETRLRAWDAIPERKLGL